MVMKYMICSYCFRDWLFALPLWSLYAVA